MTFTASSKGGEYNHAITIDEMPSHKHDISAPIASTWTNAGGNSIQGSSQSQNPYNFSWCKEAGGNKPHNNLPPYQAIYYWHRVS
ncbi:phage baseplate protein [Faecalicoccus sp. LCP19S3_E3]|uniref:phage baseplate protein n=1 Tax=unclassified Faecalicoccus TaxID=2643311 RepID=UPI003F91D6DF